MGIFTCFMAVICIAAATETYPDYAGEFFVLTFFQLNKKQNCLLLLKVLLEKENLKKKVFTKNSYSN